jgi:hypothetical protein
VVVHQHEMEFFALLPGSLHRGGSVCSLLSSTSVEFMDSIPMADEAIPKSPDARDKLTMYTGVT